MENSQYLQSTIDRFIELYGDRTGEVGDSIRSGFVWIQNTKMILLADSGTSKTHYPGSWRRLSRLVDLAEQLRRPVLLWNFSLEAAKESQGTLALDVGHVIQNGKQNLLKFPAPIISVFDDTPSGELLEYELAMADGAVVVAPADEVYQYLAISPRIRSACCHSEIVTGILGLLTEISAMPVAELVAGRTNRLRKIAEQQD